MRSSDLVLDVELCKLIDWWGNSKVIAKSANSSLNDKLILMNNYVVDFSSAYNWDISFDVNDATNRLYLHSLGFVGQLLDAYVSSGNDAYYCKAKTIYYDWLNYYKKNKNKIWTMRASDHATSIRAVVLIKLIQEFRKRSDENRTLVDIVINELIEHGNWLCDNKNHRMNNHGTMVDIALLLISLQCKNLPIADRWRITALDRLQKIFRLAFTEEGINNENSPGYHIINIRLFTSVLDLLNYYDIDHEVRNEISSMLDLALSAFRHMLHQDSTIPAIGDSSAGLARGFESINESIHYPKSGYGFLKDHAFYLSLKCGYSTLFHRHIDDSSITLRYFNEDVLIDGGFYTYDNNDPIRKYLISCEAHSGIFPSSLLSKVPLLVDKLKLIPESEVNSIVKTDNYQSLGCRYLIKKKYLIERKIVYFPPNVVVIMDQGSGLSELKDEDYILQIFNFGPSIEITRHKNGIYSGTGVNVDIELRQHLDFEALEKYIGSDNPVLGWFSTGYSKKVPITTLRFIKRGTQVRFVTSILLKKKKIVGYDDIQCHINEDGIHITLHKGTEIKNYSFDKDL